MPILSKRKLYTNVAAYAPAAAAAYTAQGVRFDGAANLQTEVGLTGSPVDAKVGMFSCWFKMMGNDGGYNVMLEGDGGTLCLSIYRWVDNKIRIVGADAGGTAVLDMYSTSTYMVGMGWKHILASWDLSAARAQLYVSDVDDRAGSPTLTNTNIDYTSLNWAIGTRFGGALGLNAEVADFYVNFATSLDISNSTNRRKFITAGLAPVDLGSDGSTPTGTAPIIYLHGAVASWHTNDGAGGGFTLTGTLTAAGSNPP
jgi:hypothetical protein